MHRHHVIATGRRYALWGVAPSERGTTDAIVGFVDMVGFTTIGATLEAAELDDLVRRFEEVAVDATRAARCARLVKLIGDEAMFVAGGGAGDAVEIVETMFSAADLPRCERASPRDARRARGRRLRARGQPRVTAGRLRPRPVRSCWSGRRASATGVSACNPSGRDAWSGFDDEVELFTLR